MAVPECDKKAKRKYKEKIRKLQIDLFPTDADITEHLNGLDMPVATYIKRLIRQDIAGENQE